MWKVLAPPVCRDTAQSLQSYLEVVAPNKGVKINWGNSGFLRTDASQVWGNKVEAVQRSANKYKFFELCKDMGTVPIINSFNGPCFQHHDPLGANGSGIRFVATEEDFIPGLLTTKQVKGSEYRVYFCYNAKPLIYLKTRLTDETPECPIRNSHNGYGYMRNPPQLRTIPNLKEVLLSYTEEVSNKIELSYGAIDFILSAEHTVYILESNSAPTLFSEELVEMFGNEFIRRWS